MAKARLATTKANPLYFDGTWLTNGHWIFRREVLEHIKLPPEVAVLVSAGTKFCRTVGYGVIACQGHPDYDKDRADSLAVVVAPFENKAVRPLRFLHLWTGEEVSRVAITGTPEDHDDSVVLFDDDYACMVIDLPAPFRLGAVDADDTRVLVVHRNDELVGVAYPRTIKKLGPAYFADLKAVATLVE